MYRLNISWLIPVILLSILFSFSGCIQPAVVQQSGATREEAVETTVVDDSSKIVETKSATPVIVPAQINSQQEEILIISDEPELEETEPVVNNDIDLPDDALPVIEDTEPLIILDEDGMMSGPTDIPVDPLSEEDTSYEFIPSDGPLDPAEEPVHLIEGWRVQIASLKSQESALTLADTLKTKITYSPHIVWRDGAYKVQVGDFPDMQSANTYKDSLYNIGYKEAFVVTGHVKIIGGEQDSLSNRGREVVHPALLKPVDGWRIQIMSVNDRSAAHKEAGIAKTRLGLPVYIEESNGVFKLRVGDFTDRDQANTARDHIIINGYSGAFPVKTKVKLRSLRYQN